MEIITRKEAKELGLKRYFTNELCIHGHTSERSVSEGKCYKCTSSRKKLERVNNGEHVRELDRQRNERDKEKRSKASSIWYEKNKHLVLKKMKIEYKDNREIIIKRNISYKKLWRKTPNGILTEFIRRSLYRIVDAVKENKTTISKKTYSYTIEELKTHIENQFDIMMTWENHGFYGWHLDHKISISKLIKIYKDKTQEEIAIIANSLENLQPLWAVDNLKKHAKSI